MAVFDGVKILPKQDLPPRKPVGVVDPVDWFFRWYNALEKAGMRMPKVKYVDRRHRGSPPEDAILRIDDDGSIRIPFKGHAPVIFDAHWGAPGACEALIVYKALQDQGLLFEYRCILGDNHELALEMAKACSTLSTDPD